VPTLVLVADNDVCLPLDGMYEIFDRIPAAKRMVVLRHADHMHFMDNVEQLHEAVRTSPPWIPELDLAAPWVARLHQTGTPTHEVGWIRCGQELREGVPEFCLRSRDGQRERNTPAS
jgi:hypothetical protein